MAHRVVANAQIEVTPKRHIDFDVSNSDGKIGMLRVSAGGIAWFGLHAKQATYAAPWAKFAALIEALSEL